MPHYPRPLPDRLTGLVGPLLDVLGPLAPADHAACVLDAVSSMPVDAVAAVGLEVVLPPHPPACDMSVLLPPAQVPPFATGSRHEPLRSLARAARSGDSTIWWEYDCSSEDPPAGAFLRQQQDGSQVSSALAAASGVVGLDRAFEALLPLIEPWADVPGRLVGFFPDRRPLPLAAALLPARADVLRALAPRVTVSVDPDSALVVHLTRHCDRYSLALAADTQGRTALSFEAAFVQRERAMADGAWTPVLDDPVWGEGRAAATALLGVQGLHRFDALPPVGVITGIDHMKVGPGDRVKAYVGAIRLQPGGTAI